MRSIRAPTCRRNFSLTWADQAASAVYDIAGGAIADLATDGGPINAGCLADDLPAPTWSDPRPDPAPGSGYYYVVRAQKSCADGTYGFATSGLERLLPTACP